MQRIALQDSVGMSCILKSRRIPKLMYVPVHDYIIILQSHSLSLYQWTC